ncbi:MAG: DMT family transporter [Alphaproteobacteria bacterium]|nr:DMT family transporter [Alphaproteobacteria bacterium]
MTSPRAKGVYLTLAAALGLSLGGVLVRHAEASAWEIVFWRSITMSLVLIAFLGVQHGRRMIAEIVRTGWAGVLCGLFLAGTFFGFVLAVQSTTVANTVVIMSTTPFFAAVFGRVVLGEAVGARTWAALAVAAVGITIMCWDSLDTATGLIGNLYALGLALCYAAHLVTIRAVGGKVDMVPSVLIAGGTAIIVALPFAWPLDTDSRSIAVSVIMGTVQVGLPLIFVTMAARYLAAAEVALLAMLEVILGPLWVWIILGEHPTALALVGGALVVGALLGNTLAAFGLRPSVAARTVLERGGASLAWSR